MKDTFKDQLAQAYPGKAKISEGHAIRAFAEDSGYTERAIRYWIAGREAPVQATVILKTIIELNRLKLNVLAAKKAARRAKNTSLAANSF